MTYDRNIRPTTRRMQEMYHSTLYRRRALSVSKRHTSGELCASSVLSEKRAAREGGCTHDNACHSRLPSNSHPYDARTKRDARYSPARLPFTTLIPTPSRYSCRQTDVCHKFNWTSRVAKCVAHLAGHEYPYRERLRSPRQGTNIAAPNTGVQQYTYDTRKV